MHGEVFTVINSCKLSTKIAISGRSLLLQMVHMKNTRLTLYSRTKKTMRALYSVKFSRTLSLCSTETHRTESTCSAETNWTC